MACLGFHGEAVRSNHVLLTMGSAGMAEISQQQIVVGVGDMAVAHNIEDTLSTYALGSCVGVVAYDPVIKVAGLLHLILPESRISFAKAVDRPAMFADTGLPLLFGALEGLKAELLRLRIYLAGGASVLNGQDPFKIGERNAQAVITWLSAQGLMAHLTHLGGTVNRTVHLEVNTGRVSLKTPTGNQAFSLVE